MSIDAIVEASRAGMNQERLRLEAASRNIASANVPVAPGAQATRVEVTSFADRIGASPRLGERPAELRQVHDPSHPLADGSGNVSYPAVDLVIEMTTLVSASRGYEANVKAFNLLRSMVLRALEIGAK